MANTARDPVCGSGIDASHPGGKSEYQGQTYYFCCEGCKKAFDADPEKYLHRTVVTDGHHH